jgi:hypothetical protein
MNIETLAVLLIIAGITALLGRALAGFTLAGCLINYVLACLGAVGGWLIQSLFLGPDNLVAVPLQGAPVSVSIIGASIGSFALAFLGGLLGRPVQPRRKRSRR